MDRISQLMRETGVDFPKAVELLAAEAGVTAANIGDRTCPAQRETALGLTLQHYGSHAFTPEETVDLARKLALFIAEG